MFKLSPSQKRAYHDWIAEQGCLVCRRPATVHHVTARADAKGRLARFDHVVTPLCPVHHQIQFGPRESVEALSHQGFYREYGIDLLATANALWEQYNG